MTDVGHLRALAFVAKLASGCSDALGDALLSVILHGSLTLDAFTPGRSDIDLLVVVGEPLRVDQLAALLESVDQLHMAAPTRVDLRVVTRETTGSPTPAPVMEVAFTLRPGRTPEIATRIDEPDLLAEFAIARAHGRSILGCAPEAVIARVPAQWLLDVGDRQLAAWQGLTDDAKHAELMLLTACRIWRFAEEGVHCSKAAAGHWALERDPSLVAVADALHQRTGEPSVPIAEDDIARVLELVRLQLSLAPAHG
jgi:predicted nucleotidyltransferase